MALTTTLTDEELALRASSGDKDAFAVLYERHFRGVYDLVVRMVREQETALDAVQNCFLNAWVSLQKRTVTGNIKAWLYTIARNSAINELRRGKRLVTLREDTPESKYAPAFARIDADRSTDPEAIVEDKEVVDLVWSSAAALSPREYSLLDLHLRRGLSTEDLSQTLGVPKSNVYTQISRLKDALEESVTVSLLMRRGRSDCPELNTLASAAGAGLTRDFRQVVSRHLRTCERCQESRKRYVAPAEIFAALALVPVPAEADKIWIGAAAGGGFLVVVLSWVLTPVRWLIGGFRDAGMPLKVALGASAVATVGVPLLVGMLLIPSSDEAEPQPPPAVRPLGVVRSPAPTTAPATPVPEPSPSPLPEDTAAISIPAPVAAGAVATPEPGRAPTATPTPPAATVATPVPTAGAAPAPPPLAPTSIQVQIGVGPPPKSVQPHSSATISMTIFGSDSFAVADVNTALLQASGAPVEHSKTRDVNSDGNLDIVVHFKVAQMVTPANSEVCLEGETAGGARFVGCGPLILKR